MSLLSPPRVRYPAHISHYFTVIIRTLGAAARGDWFERDAGHSPARLVIWAMALCASAYAWLNLIDNFARLHMIRGVDFGGVGADWMVFHSTARLYLSSDWSTIFDGERLTAHLNETYRDWLWRPLGFRPWVYPPSYLLLLAPFGFLNFLGSYVAFQAITAIALVAALVLGNRQKRTGWAIAAATLLCPAAAINVASGQNAFLIAALFVAGFRLLDRRPILAGALLGLLTIKPQFALMAPVALIAARRWPALLAAAGSAIFLAAASVAIFGVDAWTIWLHQTVQNLIAPDAQWVSAGRMWGVSTWTCATLLGGSSVLASALQLASATFAAGSVFAVFWRGTSERAQLPVLLTAALLAAPHWSPYDATFVVLAGMFWLCALTKEEETEAWRWIVVSALWALPVIGPPIVSSVARAVPVLLISFIFLTFWRRPQTYSAALRSAPSAAAPASN
jgi:alpha-1,2-mannosyltransferase